MAFASIPRNTSLKVPCMNCTDRQAYCHSTCEKYKEYTKENDELRKKLYAEKEINRTVNGYNKGRLKGIDNNKYRKKK